MFSCYQCVLVAQCPGEGEYDFRFVANCAVEIFADSTGAGQCGSETIVHMDRCETCHLVQRVQFDVDVLLSSQSSSINSDESSATISSGPTGRLSQSEPFVVDEQELEVQMSQMFQHETLPVLAFPTVISQPIDRRLGGRACCIQLFIAYLFIG